MRSAAASSDGYTTLASAFASVLHDLIDIDDFLAVEAGNHRDACFERIFDGDSRRPRHTPKDSTGFTKDLILSRYRVMFLVALRWLHITFKY
jgi:hypothetical protein